MRPMWYPSLYTCFLASTRAGSPGALIEEVVCRCGSRVHIRRIDDQWFINYADPELTRRTKEHVAEMNLLPPDFAENLPGILDWFRERACVRLGNWLGTRFPFDDKWIIEAISDSTLYPVYYTISLYANSGQIVPDQMTPEFFAGRIAL